MKWLEIGSVPLSELESARLQLHYGALLLGSAAHCMSPHAADDSHTNLGVEADVLTTHALDPKGRVTMGLQMPTLALVLREQGKQVSRFELEGETLESALRWGERQLADVMGTEAKISLREYSDFPDSDLMRGAVFASPDRSQLTELAVWYQNADGLFGALREEYPAMSPARVWPHHFDLGALLPMDEEGSRSIGVGLSPGDSYYNQPYFYCSPYPRPEKKNPPSLAFGAWHTKDFLSAIVTAEELLASAAPKATAEQYLTAAVGACKALLA